MEEKIYTISFFGGVNEKSISKLMDACDRARNEKVAEIQLLLSSWGGDLRSGFFAYNLLRSTGIPVKAINMGNVESIAVLIFLAGDVRLGVPESTFLMHGFTWNFGNTETSLEKIREAAACLEFDSERFAKIFDERTNKGFDIRPCLNGYPKRLGVEDAQRAHLISSCVADIRAIPAGTFHYNIMDDIVTAPKI